MSSGPLASSLDGGTAAESGPVLDIQNVTKYFGGFKAVDRLSFQVRPGSICGFLGPNGAGKTTTIRMILDIFKPSDGTITVLGHRSALEVRRRIGYLPEEKGLYKKMKAWSVIAYFASLKGLARKEARQRARDLLERYGLGDFAEKPTEAFSKGMAQKVQVLASIAHDPELVILDEPFSGLDPVNQQVMEEIIRDLAHRRRTILFSTHVMEHAERLCDRIVLLARGSKVFDGSIPEAKRRLPRCVRLETEQDISPLQALAEVAAARRLPPVRGAADAEGMARWELELRETADPQSILQACFARSIRLQSFNQSDPTLHEVFVRLVGPAANKDAEPR